MALKVFLKILKSKMFSPKKIKICFFLSICSATWFDRRTQHSDEKHLQFIQKSLTGKTSIRKMHQIRKYFHQKNSEKLVL